MAPGQHFDAIAAETTSQCGKVLIVDDEIPIQHLLGRILNREGYDVAVAGDGHTALRVVSEESPDVILLDIALPGGLSGLDVCRRLKQDAATRLTPVVIVTGLDAQEQRIEGLRAGADDFLNKPVDRSELLARVGTLARMKQYTDDLDSASSILTSLATMIEARDGYGAGHCHRMANYAASVGRTLGVAPDDIRTLYRGAFLHDIGMLAISDAIIRKAGPLTAEEREHVKSHTTLGDALCENLRSLKAVRPIIRWHHERLDGSGYPDGLRGDAIPLLARIVGVIDVYQAVTTKRPYQPLLSHADAMSVLHRGVQSGTLDAMVVEGFEATLRSRGLEVAESSAPGLRTPQ